MGFSGGNVASLLEEYNGWRKRILAVVFSHGRSYPSSMSVPLDTFISDGRVVISFPETAVPLQQREEFIRFLKSEWIARQSRLTASEAKTLANEVDAGWWSQNREAILRRIGGA